MSKKKMFFRMILASLVRRRSRMLVALLSIAIGATILSGLVTIYYDVPRQMGAEFRNYGANMILTPTGDEMTTEDMEAGIALIDDSALVGATPYRYESVRIHEQPLMAAGTDMAAAQTTSPYWSVDGDWPGASGEIMVGQEVAESLSLSIGESITVSYTPEGAEAEDTADTAETAGTEETADAVDLTDAAVAGETEDAVAAEVTEAVDATESAAAAEAAQAETAETTGSEDASETEDEVLVDTEMEFVVTAILSTGGSEEDYVYLSMEDLETLTESAGEIDLVEVSINCSSDQLTQYMNDINDQVESVNSRLVKKVTASETTVLSKLQALVLLVTVVVLALTMICVATTMTAVVAERRKEIGLRKAIGASDASIFGEFMGEGMLLGAVGGILGSFLGFAFAQTVSVNVFSSSISFRPLLVPITILVSIAVTGIACLFPIRSATTVDPALVLKGE